MSLTSLIRDRYDVKRFLLSLLLEKPKPSKVNAKEQIEIVSHAQVGTGFDYLFRFELSRRYKIAQEHMWIAEQGLLLLATSESEEMKVWTTPGLNTIKETQKARTRYSENPTRSNLEKLADLTLRLYYLDKVFREGTPPFAFDPSNRLLPAPHKEDIAAVIKLLDNSDEFLESQYFKSANDILLNPTFGYYSALVGGADADIVTPAAIIDLKSKKALKVEDDDLAQIIGYYILLLLNHHKPMKSIDTGKNSLPMDIDELGLYYAMHSELYRIPVSSLRITEEELNTFIALVTHPPEIVTSPLLVLHQVGWSRMEFLKSLNITTIEDLASVDSPRVLYINARGRRIMTLTVIAQDYLNHKFRLRRGVTREYAEMTFGFDDEVYLDIETTGLGEDSMIWLIGMYFPRNGELTQLMAKKSREEKVILTKFLDIARKARGNIVIFSGSYFDMNMLQARIRYHSLSQWKKVPEFRDVLNLIRETIVIPSKNGLKDMSAWMGYKFRHPDLSGMAMPFLYSEYVSKSDEKLLKNLLEYNEDDIRSLEHVVSFIRSGMKYLS